ncbi:zinc finger protein 335 [Spea bombifrons]|uniref:zinc finger protein 335 n=1 Tax=Spea bombifrons TaxID=233779 RepID=UPI002349173F|nr:zinc finger protein 335 [Spea bombifrons]
MTIRVTWCKRHLSISRIELVATVIYWCPRKCRNGVLYGSSLQDNAADSTETKARENSSPVKMNVQGQVVEETVFEKVEEETIESIYVDVPHNAHVNTPEDAVRTLGTQDLSMDQNLDKICEPCIKPGTNDMDAEETDMRQNTNTEHLLINLSPDDQNTQHVVVTQHQDNIGVQALNIIQYPIVMDTQQPTVDQRQETLDSQEYSTEQSSNSVGTQDSGIELIPENTTQNHRSENKGNQEQYTILNAASIDPHEVVIIQGHVSQSTQHQALCQRPDTNNHNVAPSQSADSIEQSSYMETKATSSTKSLDNLDPQDSGIPESLENMETQDIEQNLSRAQVVCTMQSLDPNSSIENQDNKITEVTDVSVPNENTEQMTHTQVDSCTSVSCSVPGVCSMCHSLFTQTSQPVLLHSDATGPAYTTSSSVDRIIHSSINPQLIQGCILTSAEGRNPGITQYLILQEPEDAGPSYPLALSPVAVGEMSLSHDSSCGPEAVSDMDALEGMMEVVVVQQYKCKMCQYKSASKTTLLRHVRERHVQTDSKDEQKGNVCKVTRSREEDEEEEDDIVDAGAIDDPDDDSDYSPGEEANHDHNLELADGTLAKERPRRRPGRPRKIQRIQGPEIGADLLPVSDSKVEDLISPSVTESKDSSCNSHEEQKPLNKTRGRPPKHFRGKKYRRYKSRRYYKSPNKQLLRPFLCRVCGSRFLTHEDFTFHVGSHDGNDPQTFRCQQCNYRCRRWSSLKEHMYNHKGNKPHKCDQCDYTSVYKKDVIRHSAVHKQERKTTNDLVTKPTSYPCPVCNRVYNMQKRLTQHLKTHSAEKPHMCDKCGKAFKKRYTFKMHLLTHLQSVDNSRYKCEFCEYICEDRKRLLNHQLTHMNDKPFKCSQCKYHTYRQDFLLSHEATKHSGGKPFACDYCHFTTKHKKNLRLHVQCRHAHLLQEWVQRNPEETPCRRRPFFSLQQIEELKQQHVQPENPDASAPAIQEVQPTTMTLSGVMAPNPHTELTYHMLQQGPQPGNAQPQNTLETAAIIYEQGEEEDLTTRAALDLLLNMSAQRDGQGGPLQVAVVKSGSCGEGQGSEVSAQEPHMAQVLTLHMDEREVTEVQETGYEETDVQQITINTAFTTAEYSLINTDNIQTSLCSDAEIPPESPQHILDDRVKDKNTLQVLHKPQQSQVAADHSPPPPVAKKFSCKICGSSFWGRAEMESHKRAHVEGGSGFKCHDCTFVAASWPEIRDHMSLHSDLRPHRCNQCSFASRNKKDLSRHAMTHTNHRPHSCHLCGQRFNRKGHLKFHIQRLHGGVSAQQPENEELTTAPSLEEEHIFLTQEETVTNQENTAYIQEITTADGQTLQQLVTADNQVQYIISQEGVPHLIPQEYVVLPEGHHIQVQDGQITHIQYEPGAQFLQDPQIHFVPMSPTQQLLTQEQLQAAAHSAVTAVADAAATQTVYTAEREDTLQQEIEYDVITLTD